MELIGGAIGIRAYAALRQGTKIYTIADDIPLLNYLSGMTCLNCANVKVVFLVASNHFGANIIALITASI